MDDQPTHRFEWPVLIFIIAFMLFGALAQKYFPPTPSGGGQHRVSAK